MSIYLVLWRIHSVGLDVFYRFLYYTDRLNVNRTLRIHDGCVREIGVFFNFYTVYLY